MSIGNQQPVEAFPVQIRSATTGKTGISIVVHTYSNRYFVVITEADSYSIGSIIQVVRHEQTGGLDIGPSATVFDISIQFGSENPELLLAARVLASKVNFDKPVLFGLALRNFNKDIYAEISEQLQKLIQD